MYGQPIVLIQIIMIELHSLDWYNKTTKNWSWACMGCHNGKKDLNSRYKNYGTDCFAFLQWMSDYKGSKHVLTFPEAIKVLASKLNLSIPAFSNKM